MNKSTAPAVKDAPFRSKGMFKDFLDLGKLWPFLKDSKGLVFISMGLIPLLSLLQMYQPVVLKHSIDEGIMKGDAAQVSFWALLFLGIIVFDYILRSAQSLATSLAVHRMIKRLRQTLIKHVMSLSSSYHDHALSGALVTRATSDFDNLSESLNQGVLTSLVDIAVLVGVLVGMFSLNWKLALFVLLILPFVAKVIGWFSNAMKVAMLSARKILAALNAFTQESLYGISTIKLLTAEKAAKSKFDEKNIEYRQAQMKSVMLDAFMFAVLDGIASVTVGLLMWMAFSWFAGTEVLSAGLLVAFVQYLQQIFEPLKQLGNKIAMLQGAFTSIDRIFGLIDRKDKVVGSFPPPTIIKGSVNFEHVTYSYKGKSGPYVLKNISFAINSGESLALVGATGSGKSTTIKLLTKLYDGYEGKIQIDHQDIKDWNGPLLRKSIAVVPQDIVLFDGSIAFNISLGIEGISRENIISAARIVGADQFIEALPGSYDFQIKEQGANLSHGQRQLIAFARALAKNPSLVVLDEATSSLDPASEVAVQHAIDNILKGRTVIVIAHRLSTVRKCNQIIVMDRGEIIERGDHKGLLANKGHYFRLHSALAH